MRQRGDTIIEVILAVTIFSLVAVGGIGIMNQGAATAQRSLEIGLVRAQIDAQADALRYAHDAYVSSLGSGDPEPKAVWDALATKHAVTAAQSLADSSDGRRCQLVSPGIKAPSKPASNAEAFAIDTRKLDGKNTPGIFAGTSKDPTIPYEAAALTTLGVTPVPSAEEVPISSMADNNSHNFPVTYAQVRYDRLNDVNTVAVAQGIWIQAVYTEGTGTPQSLGYYDFNIRACWLTPGQQAPVTLGTVVRLYDPES